MSAQNLAFLSVLVKYPVETTLYLLLVVGPIMIYFGANRDDKGKITNYNTSVSIIGWILTIVDILAFFYYIYYYFIAKHK